MTVAWMEPPPIGGPQDPRSVWMERLRPLMRKPGEWAVIKSGTPSACHGAAAQLKLRQVHVPPGQWEFTVRTFQRGVHGDRHVGQLYARYHGEEVVRSYLVSQDAVFDTEGRRVCPDCGEVLERPFYWTMAGTPRYGKWPKRCDACWSRLDSKWARKRARKQSDGAA